MTRACIVASLVAQLEKNLPAIRRPRFNPGVGKIPWRRGRLPTPVFWPREFHKNIYFCFINYVKPLTVWITTNCGKFFKR